MKVIEYARLIAYLIEEEGLNPISAYRNIQRIRVLPTDYKEAVLCVLNGGVPSLEIDGMSFSSLTEYEGMKPIRAILLLDWLKREPAIATRYMASQRWRSPIHPLTEKEKTKVMETLERLQSRETSQTKENHTDIEV